MKRWRVGVVTRVSVWLWQATVVRFDASGRVIETAIFEDFTANGAIRSRDRFLNESRS